MSDQMISSYAKSLVIALISITFSFSFDDAKVAPVIFEKHDLSVTLDIPAYKAQFADMGVMKIQKGWNLFQINRNARIKSFETAGKDIEYIAILLEDTTSLPEELQGKLPADILDSEQKIVLFESIQAGVVDFSIEYSSEFFEDVSNVRFSSEMVGREVSGTILDKGAYLSSDAYFYPRGNEGLLQFQLTVNIPEEWESISDGNRLSSRIEGGRKIQSWKNPFKSDGLTFMAAPYETKSIWADTVEVTCYFFVEDTALFDKYLSATANYIQMYSDLIGPYPYNRFTVAENFFPTGYGMPAWTLLGQQVLRLPFIVYTSLGHEVLHNWWGNSVYVDYERGNWCESATVYGADYRYKLQRSSEAAKAYRKDILKQYVSYINEENDFPIREFQSRTSPNTRTIGYNKAMMVFHMIEEEIGSDAFFESWRNIYSKYRGEKISWEEWMEAFEASSGISLDHIIPQWIDQSGAVILDFEIVSVQKIPEEEKLFIELKISERSGQKYRLRIPFRFTGDTVLDTSVVMGKPEDTFTFDVPAAMKTVELDPDYHLFRRLYPEEIEPIVSAILGKSEKRFIVETPDNTEIELFRTFGQNVTESAVDIYTFEILDSENKDFAPILLNPPQIPDYLNKMILMESESVSLDGTEYSIGDHTFILTGKNWRGFDYYMIVLSKDLQSLPRIGELIPHYGKYSYLIFRGSKNVGKGQWSVKDSPLKKKIAL